MKDKIKNSENEMRKKSLIVMAKKSEEDNKPLKKKEKEKEKESNQKYYEYSFNTMLSTNAQLGDDVAECVSLLSTDELQLPSNAQKVSSSENRKIYINENIPKKIVKEEERYQVKKNKNLVLVLKMNQILRKL